MDTESNEYKDGYHKCLLQPCEDVCVEADAISEVKWKNIKEKSELWIGLDKFGSVYSSTKWDSDRENSYCHKQCYMNLTNSRKLEQAKNRKKKQDSAKQKQGSLYINICYSM